MRALVVTKPTNLEQHGEVVRSQIKRGYLNESHILDLEQAHREHYESLALVEKTFEDQGISYKKISRGEKWDQTDNFDFVTSVGGDGTLLSASHRIVSSIPVIFCKNSKKG